MEVRFQVAEKLPLSMQNSPLLISWEPCETSSRALGNEMNVLNQKPRKRPHGIDLRVFPGACCILAPCGAICKWGKARTSYVDETLKKKIYLWTKKCYFDLKKIEPDKNRSFPCKMLSHVKWVNLAPHPAGGPFYKQRMSARRGYESRTRGLDSAGQCSSRSTSSTPGDTGLDSRRKASRFLAERPT